MNQKYFAFDSKFIRMKYRIIYDEAQAFWAAEQRSNHAVVYQPRYRLHKKFYSIWNTRNCKL